MNPFFAPGSKKNVLDTSVFNRRKEYDGRDLLPKACA
jgi:hypothetical protein